MISPATAFIFLTSEAMLPTDSEHTVDALGDFESTKKTIQSRTFCTWKYARHKQRQVSRRPVSARRKGPFKS